MSFRRRDQGANPSDHPAWEQSAGILRAVLALSIPLIWMGISSCRTATPSGFDLVITNGQIIDGSGSAGFPADIGITGDTIVRVGTLSEAEKEGAREMIDATGLVVSPGFIDIHSHSDWALLVDGTAQSKIRQGVTTEILGESLSAGPRMGSALNQSAYGIEPDWTTLGEYFGRLQAQGISLNIGSFVGATQVRLCVLGEDSRDPTPRELEAMKLLVREAMEQGAFGLSSALLVPPNTYITTEQLIELANTVRPYGGIYSTHIRSEGEGIEEAIEEAIEIGRSARVPVDILHLKIADRRLWGRMPEVYARIEEARKTGLEITANQYPYTASQNNLVALVPPWAMEGGRETMLRRLEDPAIRKRIERDICSGIPGWFNHYLAVGDWEGCVAASVQQESNKPFEGRSIAEIAKMTGKTPLESVLDLLVTENGSVPAVYFLMNDADVRYAMRIPWVSFGSDGSAVRPEGILGQGKPHPRWYGTFPRILGHYCREEGVLPLEEAIRKMTSLNAKKLGITDRGLIAEQKKADITIFDAGRIIDRATFDDPHQYPDGIEHVIVNGVPVLARGVHLGTKPGRVLQKYIPDF